MITKHTHPLLSGDFAMKTVHQTVRVVPVAWWTVLSKLLSEENRRARQNVITPDVAVDDSNRRNKSVSCRYKKR